MSDPRLPNFFVLGAAKAGTTTLHSLLGEHPDVFVPAVKEPQFFCNDDLYSKGLIDYVERHFGKADGFAARGDFTPHYLCFERTARQIARDIPSDHQRFVVLFRDPVKRAYSLYWNMVAEGQEDLPFGEALAAEPQRLMALGEPCTCTLKYRYVDSGLYAQQVERYFNHFGREQFLFLTFDELVSAPKQLLRKVTDFLALRPLGGDLPVMAKNRSGMPRSRALHSLVRQSNPIKSLIKPLLSESLRLRVTGTLARWNKKTVQYPSLDPALEVQLRDLFAPDVERLMALTGLSLGHWLPQSERDT